MSPMPTPRMTDDEVRALPLAPALDALLGELLAEATPRRRRWPIAVAAAASVAAVLAVPSLVADNDRTGLVPGAPAATSAQPSTVPDPATDPAPEPEIVPDRQSASPWEPPTNLLALEASGWSVDVDQLSSARTGVSVTYVNGSRAFTLEWSIARQWRSQRDSAGRESSFTSVEVLGVEGQYVAYASEQQMVYLPPVDGYGLRIDAAFTTPEEFRDLLDKVRAADDLGLPEGVVTPAQADDAVASALVAVDVPDDFVAPVVVGWNGRYQLAAAVITEVGCAWAHHYADEGPAATTHRAEALAAMQGSRRWPLLVQHPVAFPGWFDDTVDAMRRGAPGRDVLGLNGCSPSGLTRAPR